MATVREGNKAALVAVDATKTMKLDDGTSLEAVTLIRDLNIAMTWLNYPGRSNGTAKAAGLDFAAPAGKR